MYPACQTRYSCDQKHSKHVPSQGRAWVCACASQCVLFWLQVAVIESWLRGERYSAARPFELRSSPRLKLEQEVGGSSTQADSTCCSSLAVRSASCRTASFATTCPHRCIAEHVFGNLILSNPSKHPHRRITLRTGNRVPGLGTPGLLRSSKPAFRLRQHGLGLLLCAGHHKVQKAS